MEKFLEADLFEPIQKYYEKLGAVVQGEVKDCDIAIQLDHRLILIEMKKAFNLKLVYQAMDRQSISEEVYVAIPRPTKGQKSKAWKSMLKLLKRLELGLITVALDSPLKTVDILLEPGKSTSRRNTRKTNLLQKEMQERTGEYNIGGVNKTKIATAYREKAIEIACLLEGRGEVSLKTLAKLTEISCGSICQRNFYHWFEKKGKGIYQLSQIGTEELKNGFFPEIIAFYRQKAEKSWRNYDENKMGL